MKKKKCILLLSLSLVFSMFTSSMSYAEENEILMDETVEVNEVNDGGENAESELIESDIPISVESIQTVELNTPTMAEEQAAVQELAAADEIPWEDSVDLNLSYRYIGTTLYIKLIDVNKPQGTAKRKAWPWTDKEAEARAVTKIEICDGVEFIDNYWFKGGSSTPYFSKLTEVVLPSSVKAIKSQAFSGDAALSSINLTNVEEFELAAFQQNKALSQLSLDHAKNIAMFAFNDCAALQSLSLGQADVKVAKNAFASCDELSRVCYVGSNDEWQAICASERKILAGVQAVHCKAEEAPKAATCTEAGDKTSVCEICNEVYKDDNGTENPALGHDYVSSVTKEATCAEDGVQTDTCTRCGDTKTQAIKALGHDYATEYTVDVAATCTAAGSQSRHCTRCGEADPDSVQEIPAFGHDYVSKVTKEATCTEDGVQTDTCTRCGDTKTQAIKATGHQWSDWTKTADATVNGAEQQQRTCVTCGAVETKTVGEKLAPTATVNASTVTLKVKQSTKGLKVTGLAKGDSVAAWKSTNTKVFTVKGNADGTCTLTGKKKGSAKLEITLASGLTKTVTVKVQKTAVKTSKVKVAEKKLTVKKGEKASLKAAVAPFTSAQKLTYTSSNKKVATVSKNGVVTAKKAGTAKITVKSGSKKVTVTITVPKTKTSSITVAKDITVKKGKTYRLKAKVAPKNSDEKITYTSSNKKIATVTKRGKVKGIKKGTATITVKSGSETVKVKVTVK